MASGFHGAKPASLSKYFCDSRNNKKGPLQR